MTKPLHIQIRQKINNILNGLFGKLASQKAIQKSIDKNKIKNILIIRPNYRIGNLIFLTPLVNELGEHLPEAKIDMIIGMKLAGQILEGLPNVEKVIDIPRRLLYHPFALLGLIRTVRKKKYDLTLNIADGSMSSQIVLSLINSKYKASFTNDKNWASLTHTIKRENLYTHSGSQPLEFLKLFDFPLPLHNRELDIKLTLEERQKGKEALEIVLKKAGVSENSKRIALFRNARFDKRIDDAWWLAWYEALQKHASDIVVIDILSPDILTKLHSDFLEYSNKDLRVLGAFFAECDLYVSADTGPLHLSLASQAKTLALFNKTSTETYGTLGKENKTININDLSPKEVAQLTYSQIIVT